MIDPLQSVRYPALLAAIATLAWPLEARCAEPENELQSVWALASAFQFNAALDRLKPIAPSDESRLAEALALLNRQPRTNRTVDAAEEMLAALAFGPSPVAPEAAYYHARVPDAHRYERDASLALERYAAAYSRWPEDAFGQRAFIHAALLRIAAEAAKGSDLAGLAADLEAEGERLSISQIRRNFHLLMADLYERYQRDDAAAAIHLERALALGIPSRPVRLDAYARAGTLASRAGETDAAIRHWNGFLEHASGDPRADLIQKKIVAAKAQLKAP
jgi:hypothetical protein